MNSRKGHMGSAALTMLSSLSLSVSNVPPGWLYCPLNLIAQFPRRSLQCLINIHDPTHGVEHGDRRPCSMNCCREPIR
ncbi:hypothetical protein B0I37DRAFT_67969 [Chaetomium sp. MPI-CAGE-AT-0009]|nr:hypothetical protein B0I37DRAFT_67969 [Chaetomium sp. MPI-CAGE-AT-0009]